MILVSCPIFFPGRLAFSSDARCFFRGDGATLTIWFLWKKQWHKKPRFRNYLGGAFCYVSREYSGRVKIILKSWRTANNIKEEKAKDPDEDTDTARQKTPSKFTKSKILKSLQLHPLVRSRPGLMKKKRLNPMAATATFVGPSPAGPACRVFMLHLFGPWPGYGSEDEEEVEEMEEEEEADWSRPSRSELIQVDHLQFGMSSLKHGGYTRYKQCVFLRKTSFAIFHFVFVAWWFHSKSGSGLAIESKIFGIRIAKNIMTHNW